MDNNEIQFNSDFDNFIKGLFENNHDTTIQS